MSKKHDYRCMLCDKRKPPEELIAKRVQFTEVKRGGRLLKSRVLWWLCRDCVHLDGDWNSPKFVNAPGMKGSKVDTSQSGA